MKFEPTRVEGVVLIRLEPIEDERGFFARTYDESELRAHGLDPTVVQRSISYSKKRGTLRGMHFQAAPHEETKLVSCSRGSIYDVVIDLRPASKTFRAWHAATLTADNHEILYVPKGCAHGLITLTDDTVVTYDISEPHHPESARGVRYDDPAFGVEWPFEPIVISARDRGYPLHER